MGRKDRIVLTGIPHHVTQRGVRSMDIFESEIDINFYIKLLSEYSEKHDLEILSWCLMTNHVHLIVVPGSEESLSKAIGEAHKYYSCSFNKRHGVKGALFQSRFYSTPMSLQHYHAAVRYVLCNPVRAGIVQDPFEYQWSSAAFHAGIKKYDPLVSDPNILDSVEDWTEYLSEDSSDIELIRKNTKTGRPCGDKDFIAAAERITGRSIHKIKPGPKIRCQDT